MLNAIDWRLKYLEIDSRELRAAGGSAGLLRAPPKLANQRARIFRLRFTHCEIFEYMPHATCYRLHILEYLEMDFFRI